MAKKPAPKKPPVRKPAPKKPTPPRRPPPRKPPVRPKGPAVQPRYTGNRPTEYVAPAPSAAPAPAAPPPSSGGDGMPRQIYGPGSRGQDARWDVRGLPKNEKGEYVDAQGNTYDENGLSISGRKSDPNFQGKPSDQMDGDQWGSYLGGGGAASGAGGGGGSGFGGGVIPGAGTYLYEQAMAQGAYDKAIAALASQKSARQAAAGLGKDWNVDPMSQFGGYQQMLRGQGLELDDAEAQAMGRGLQGAGLGRQAEGMARYGHTVQNLGFRAQLSDWENEYQSGVGNAEFAKQQAMLEALRAAQEASYGDWGDSGGYDEGGYDDTQTSYASTARSALGIPVRTAPKVTTPKLRYPRTGSAYSKAM
jgi:hypothetical protein